MHEVRKRGVIFAIHEHVCGGGGVGIHAIAIAGGKGRPAKIGKKEGKFHVPKINCTINSKILF